VSNCDTVTFGDVYVKHVSKLDTRMTYTCPIGSVYNRHVSNWTRVIIHASKCTKIVNVHIYIWLTLSQILSTWSKYICTLTIFVHWLAENESHR
jgi:hypothetical protein